MDMERRYFTTHEAGQLLGVSLPTVINWIKAGRLSAHRTPGGHRRIERDTLVAFIRRHGLPMPPELLEESSAPRVLVSGRQIYLHKCCHRRMEYRCADDFI